MSHLNIAFDRYASMGTVMHYILVINKREVVIKNSKLRINKIIKIHKYSYF